VLEMSDNKTTYYHVALVLPATWKKHIYTYSSGENLSQGQVVIAPFGKSDKLGYVLSRVDKPDFVSKPITNKLSYSLPKESRDFIAWLVDFYPSAPGAHVQHFLPSLLKSKMAAPHSTPSSQHAVKLTKLTPSQTKAFKTISESENDATVVHGVTGSGKTRLYSELVKTSLDQGKNALILFPEISLSSQLENTLVEEFGKDTVSVYHSKRTPAQQKQTWAKIYNSGGGSITIGPRSALFLPHSNLGVVIVDEAHDSAYKQDDGSRYNGVIAAGALAKIHKAKFILGSATPPVQETSQILAKGGTLVCMHETALTSANHRRQFTLVDMTDKNNLSSSFMLSKQLIESVRQSLDKSMQSLLFLNRRGTARMLMCEDCGWHAECQRCELPLTYHHDNFKMLCHTCGLTEPVPTTCPHCTHKLTQRSPGTKAVELELQKLFPQARIARYDSDNSKNESFVENYTDIKSGKVNIILGTQLVTKGLDLPLLDTVGVLQADSALLLPDYTSEERAFQQLTQVSGRVGRGHNSSSHVVLQTFQPNSKLFSLIQDQDWHKFYTQELKRRSKTKFPPYSYAIKISVSKSSSEKAQKAAAKLYEELSGLQANIKLLGPAPSFYLKKLGKYSWQIIVLSPSRKTLSGIASTLPKDFLFDLDPVSLL